MGGGVARGEMDDCVNYTNGGHHGEGVITEQYTFFQNVKYLKLLVESCPWLL